MDSNSRPQSRFPIASLPRHPRSTVLRPITIYRDRTPRATVRQEVPRPRPSPYCVAMTDWAEVYRANVDAITGLAEGLTAEQVSHRVPATPDWDVHDVLAHLAGSPADALSGRMDGAPSAGWTGRHVAERSGRSVAQLLAELRGSVDGVVASLDGSDSPALVWNAAVHHADLHEALGTGALPEPMWRPVPEAIASRSLGESAEALQH